VKSTFILHRLNINYDVGFREMKKLLGIAVLGLLWYNVGFAIPDIAGSVWRVTGTAPFKLPNNPYVIHFFHNDQ
jgi:hypothetical protein|tara:strand:- start:591 stop:812 length:222 start_codon:yes stop_codon:yes gene_type:complete